jgi:hypothetical protein
MENSMPCCCHWEEEISATTFDKSIKIALSESCSKEEQEKSDQEVIVQLLLASSAREKNLNFIYSQKKSRVPPRCEINLDYTR